MVSDEQCEQALLSSLINYGFDSYHDIAAIGINSNTFTKPTNQILYKCLEFLFEKRDVKEIDHPLIIDSAKCLGYEKWINEEHVREYIEEVSSIKTKLDNAGKFAKKVRKIEVANNIAKGLEEAQERIAELTGDESLGEIFGLIESKLSNLAGFLSDSSEDPINLADKIREHINQLANDPVDQMGLPTGFPIFDKCIGGGLRKHAITIIGARPKCGKSTMCKNMAYNVAKRGIPVLYLDTEMETSDQMNRLVSSVADVTIDDIESGKFAENPIYNQNVDDAVEEIKTVSFRHKNIAGMPFESQLAIIRKWLIRNVGLDKDGKAKDCLLVYDYIKMMDTSELSKGIQEYQALGFLVTGLQNYAVKYDIPILAAVQLNRDGISAEDTSVIGGSDRIAMYGSSISLLKWKTPEEMESENFSWGNQKLVPLISRYGAQMDQGDYINVCFDKFKNKMIENGTRGNSQTYKKPDTKKDKYEYSKKKTSKKDPNDIVDKILANDDLNNEPTIEF